MKYIEVTKSEDDPMPMLDQPCRMGFGYGDMRRLQKLFNAPLIGDETTWSTSLLGRLGNQDANVISAFMAIGLANYRKKLDQEDTDKLIEAYLDGGGEMNDLVKLIRRALEAGNHIPKKKSPSDTGPTVEDTPRGPLVVRD